MSDTNPPQPVPFGGGVVISHGSQGDNIPLPDWSISNDGKGLLESSVKIYYTNNTNEGGQMSNVPTRGQSHPYDGRLKCHKVSFTQGRNNIGYAQADYIGLAQDPTVGEWEISGSTSEQSMIFHPDFKTMAIVTEGTVGSSGVGGTPTKWKPWITVDKETNEFERFNILSPKDTDMAGVESYLTASATARVTYYTANGSAVGQVINGMATYASVPHGATNMPSNLSGGGNWLMTGGSVSQYGSLYKIQTEWKASTNKKPWNKFIYKAFA